VSFAFEAYKVENNFVTLTVLLNRICLVTDMTTARNSMIESQLRPNRVNDERIIAAMRTVKREDFVPKEKRSVAYVDETLEVAGGRFLMEPRVFARMLVSADVQSSDLVLDIGCASGYSAAVLAGLADAVVALESDEILADAAEETLTSSDAVNVAVIKGKLNEGVAKQGPYDVIFIAGAVTDVPPLLTDQLKDGGRLLCVLMDGTVGRAHMITRDGDSVSGQNLFDAHAEILPGFEAQEGFVF